VTDIQISPPTPTLEEVAAEPLWRVRLRLSRRTFGQNWKIFRRNRLGMVGLTIICVFAVMAIAHPILMATVWDPFIYDPVTGHDAPVVEKTVVEEVSDPDAEIQLTVARLTLNDPFIQVGDTVRIADQPAAPSSAHWLGTDPQGRDVLSQLLYSSRAAFFLGFIASIVTVLIGTTVGAVAAYYGGFLDGALMRFADLILVVPLIPVLIVVSGFWSLSLPLLGLVIGILSGFGGTAIILKSQALQVKVKPFVEAARVAGGSNRHLIGRHIIPNVLPLSFLYMMFTVTDAISLEATLSYFGLLSIPMSWGIMINTASTQGYLLTGLRYWWLLFPAGLAVSFLAGAFFLVGRAMDEVVNPRLRRR
jgi:peptide/nickel transport system permease protein